MCRISANFELLQMYPVSAMKDPKRLSLRDNHIWLIFLQLHQMLYPNKQATY